MSERDQDEETVPVIGMAGQPPRRISVKRLEEIEKANAKRKPASTYRPPHEAWQRHKWGIG